jgi:hypothetical protein
MLKFGTSPFLECSSKGDRRFSAFYARLNEYDGRSIEEIYQASKMFEDGSTGFGWREAKGRECVNKDHVKWLYSKLWDLYFEENPNLLKIIKQYGGFTDIFGQSNHCCQAEEIWRIRNES